MCKIFFFILLYLNIILYNKKTIFMGEIEDPVNDIQSKIIIKIYQKASRLRTKRDIELLSNMLSKVPFF